ncbi:uncharacterized protein TRAVEDRAFT_46720 [Trametes versicolor FP-101664 SS1]|uniref:uncharacterized protein n=1 Tax=Trametes versicolor (strain FP-101664) TaxID=717944 RepID=UPI000462418D|nr:uncharacterized protein TRAVEDRAFT_46720 [Trametes versicolor FP-101664 SS1]EIW59411.1 hypothetical protein TRAVEDRAFT_46720 [Trametes versicolor FP-101664 SS1]
MPRELPGMYWDEEKNRYFPLSSRPAGALVSSTPPVAPSTSLAAPPSAQSAQSRKRRKLARDEQENPPCEDEGLAYSSKSAATWRNLNAFREASSGGRLRRCIHGLQSASISARSAESELLDNNGRFPLDVGETVSALCTRVDESGDSNMWIGGGSGWLYTMNSKEPDHRWREFYLGTQVTSITSSGPTTLVTSLGSPARALVTRAQTVGLWLLREFPTNLCNDAWCGHVYNRTIVVGGRRGAVCFVDAERDQYVRLHCESDVFSVRLQNQNLMYIGMRNGVVERWDLRQPGAASDTVVNMSSKADRTGGAPVQHLRLVHQHGLLVETMRGDLEVHDLRFLRDTTPLIQFDGHVSSYQHRLGIAIDSEEDFLFAGGGDSRLRAWSLRTGDPLHDDIATGPISPGSNPLKSRYPRPICALEFVPDNQQTHLWAGSHTHLHRIQLGPNGVLR